MAIAKRKKKFFEVEIPLISKETQLQAFEVSELKGRSIKYDLTRMLRGKSVILSAKVKIEKEKAIAYPKKMEILGYFLRRMVRKGTNYVEDSFEVECKDAILRVKPFLVTRRKVSRRVRKALREKTKEELISYLKKKNTEEIFENILRNSLQKSLSLKLKKIYPLSLCEIRVITIEKELENFGKEEKKVAKKATEEESSETKPVEKKTEKEKTSSTKEVKEKKEEKEIKE